MFFFYIFSIFFLYFRCDSQNYPIMIMISLDFSGQGVFIHFHGHGQEWTSSRTSPAARVHSCPLSIVHCPLSIQQSILVHSVHRVHSCPCPSSIKNLSQKRRSLAIVARNFVLSNFASWSSFAQNRLCPKRIPGMFYLRITHRCGLGVVWCPFPALPIFVVLA